MRPFSQMLSSLPMLQGEDAWTLAQVKPFSNQGRLSEVKPRAQLGNDEAHRCRHEGGDRASGPADAGKLPVVLVDADAERLCRTVEDIEPLDNQVVLGFDACQPVNDFHAEIVQLLN